MAKAIWDWSPTAMTPQGHLSKEEVESIFTYVDNMLHQLLLLLVVLILVLQVVLLMTLLITGGG
jgi:hypothetical protein